MSILKLFSEKYFYNNEQNAYPRWKCFVKGISTTHVIITVLPASEKDVRLFTSSVYAEEFFGSNSSETNYKSGIFNIDLTEKYPYSTLYMKDINTTDYTLLKNNESELHNQFTTDVTSKTVEQENSQDSEGSLVLPVYVYDSSLALLIDTLTDKLKTSHNKDIYQDHTFRIGHQECKDFVELKVGYNSKPASPEPKSEDSDNSASGK